MNQIPGGTRSQNKAMSKEKKQLIVLGGLGAVLVGVLVIQFGGGEDSGGAPGAVATPAVALAQTSPSATSTAPTEIVPGEENEALSARGIGVRKNPFGEFWASDEPEVVETVAPVAPPPSMTVNGTLTSGKTPIAIIDGQVRHVGDVISGWTLVGVEQRAVRMRSPTGATKTYEMPLLPGGR